MVRRFARPFGISLRNTDATWFRDAIDSATPPIYYGDKCAFCMRKCDTAVRRHECPRRRKLHCDVEAELYSRWGFRKRIRHQSCRKAVNAVADDRRTKNAKIARDQPPPVKSTIVNSEVITVHAPKSLAVNNTAVYLLRPDRTGVASLEGPMGNVLTGKPGPVADMRLVREGDSDFHGGCRYQA